MIDEIWRYPVKSCSGEMVDLALIGTRGVDHDRSWAVVDRETGLVASAKHPRQWGSLLMIRSMVWFLMLSIILGRPSLTFNTGSTDNPRTEKNSDVPWVATSLYPSLCNPSAMEKARALSLSFTLTNTVPASAIVVPVA
ncbi:MAG: hypothetical protein GY773_22535, partial [Actinomycetia bacterium]|nr:hypothetical protein [Actinomycetes bacterium]